MPRKPKLIFQICQKLKRGLFIAKVAPFSRLYLISFHRDHARRARRQRNAQHRSLQANLARRAQTVNETRIGSDAYRRGVELNRLILPGVVKDDDDRIGRRRARKRIMLIVYAERQQLAAPQWRKLAAQLDDAAQVIEDLALLGRAAIAAKGIVLILRPAAGKIAPVIRVSAARQRNLVAVVYQRNAARR